MHCGAIEVICDGTGGGAYVMSCKDGRRLGGGKRLVESFEAIPHYESYLNRHSGQSKLTGCDIRSVMR